MNGDTRSFPIQSDGVPGSCSYERPSCIPWWLAEIAYEYYSERFGTTQSLERLAERGGFGRSELIGLLRREL